MGDVGAGLPDGVPSDWVTGDEVYGRDHRPVVWLEQWHRPSVLATNELQWYPTSCGPQEGRAVDSTATLHLAS